MSEATQLNATVDTPDSLTDPSQWGQLLNVTCTVAMEIAIQGFTVGNLLRLEPGAVIDSGWGESDDIPIQVNGRRIGVAEFEAVGERMAMRVSEWT